VDASFLNDFAWRNNAGLSHIKSTLLAPFMPN